MSTRGLTLAALAASALTGLGDQFREGIDFTRFISVPDEFAPLLEGIQYGRSHTGGHKGQMSKKVSRQRRRNQLRRETHHRQRGLPGRYEPLYEYV